MTSPHRATPPPSPRGQTNPRHQRDERDQTRPWRRRIRTSERLRPVALGVCSQRATDASSTAGGHYRSVDTPMTPAAALGTDVCSVPQARADGRSPAASGTRGHRGQVLPLAAHCSSSEPTVWGRVASRSTGALTFVIAHGTVSRSSGAARMPLLNLVPGGCRPLLGRAAQNVRSEPPRGASGGISLEYASNDHQRPRR